MKKCPFRKETTINKIATLNRFDISERFENCISNECMAWDETRKDCNYLNGIKYLRGWKRIL